MSEKNAQRPNWFDDDFLKTCIRNSQHLECDTNIKIKHLDISNAIAQGENNLSLVLRANVKYQTEDNADEFEESFVVKVAHDFEEMAILSSMFFRTETDMYKNILPKVMEILEDSTLNTTFNCRFFHNIEDKAIVLEDLKPLEFVVADRIKGFNLEVCKVVCSKLAKFHAAGMCYFYSQSEDMKSKYAKFPMDEQELNENINNRAKGKGLIEKSRVKNNIEELKEYGNKYCKAIEYLTRYADCLGKTIAFIKMRCIPGNKFYTICHADFWVNNIMLKYKPNGSISDAIFVDFQGSHYNTIAYDFFYLIFTSTTLEVRKNNYDEIKKLYLDSLVGYLKELDYKGDIPTMHEFEEELKRTIIVALFCLNSMLPMILQKFDKQKFAEAHAGTKIMEPKITDRNYLDKMVASIDILQNHGFLDIFPESLF